MADSLLDDSAQNELYEAFELLETERMGEGQHDKYHELLKHLAAKYLEGHSGHHHHA